MVMITSSRMVVLSGSGLCSAGLDDDRPGLTKEDG